jgi:putative ribosome biogenesis GTPase RsgA
MKKFKRYFNPFLILGIVLVVVFVISWIVWPWKNIQGGFWELLGKAVLDVITAGGGLFSIYKGWKGIKKANKGESFRITNQNGIQAVLQDVKVNGDLTLEQTQVSQTIEAITPEAEIVREDKAKRAYLQALQTRCQFLNTAALGKETNDLTLDQVYIDLDTTILEDLEQEPDKKKKKDSPYLPDKDKQPISVLKAVTRSRKVVLLGAPGAGKSTFVKKL